MLAGLAATLIACGDDDAAGPTQVITGTYTLTAVDSKSLPATLYDDGATELILVSGTITLSANNAWSGSVIARTVTNSVSTDETLPSGGTWVQSGSSITFTDTINGDSFTAVVGTDMLSAAIDFEVPIGIVTLVFTK